MQILIRKKKENNSKFSQRSFAKKLGFTSSTFNDIAIGKRKLTKRSFEKLKHGLAQEPETPAAMKELNSKNIQKKQLPQAFADETLIQIVRTSQLAQNHPTVDPFFCALIISAEKNDFEFLRKKILEVMEKHSELSATSEIKITFAKIHH